MEAAQRLGKQHAEYHRIEAEVIERVRYARGRPRKNAPRKVSAVTFLIRGVVVERSPVAEQKREQAGCFVLLTNTPVEGEMRHTPREVLLAYKEQHGIERDFGFLKDPLIVNDMFLKNPGRLEALGFILLSSLLVWALVEDAPCSAAFSISKPHFLAGTPSQQIDPPRSCRPPSSWAFRQSKSGNTNNLHNL